MSKQYDTWYRDALSASIKSALTEETELTVISELLREILSRLKAIPLWKDADKTNAVVTCGWQVESEEPPGHRVSNWPNTISDLEHPKGQLSISNWPETIADLDNPDGVLRVDWPLTLSDKVHPDGDLTIGNWPTTIDDATHPDGILKIAGDVNAKTTGTAEVTGSVAVTGTVSVLGTLPVSIKGTPDVRVSNTSLPVHIENDRVSVDIKNEKVKVHWEDQRVAVRNEVAEEIPVPLIMAGVTGSIAKVHIDNDELTVKVNNKVKLADDQSVRISNDTLPVSFSSTTPIPVTGSVTITNPVNTVTVANPVNSVTVNNIVSTSVVNSSVPVTWLPTAELDVKVLSTSETLNVNLKGISSAVTVPTQIVNFPSEYPVVNPPGRGALPITYSASFADADGTAHQHNAVPVVQFAAQAANNDSTFYEAGSWTVGNDNWNDGALSTARLTSPNVWYSSQRGQLGLCTYPLD